MPINGLTFQKKLVVHSTPTLLKMKTGNIFRIYKTDVPNFQECYEYFKNHLIEYDIDFQILKDSKNSILLYVYQPKQLNKLLSCHKIENFLNSYGYANHNPIDYLKYRFEQVNCPHEIGIFLGYPLNDVISFIEQKECQLIGYWKAYSNIKNVKRTFYKYDCCYKTVRRRVDEGELIFDIIKKLQ